MPIMDGITAAHHIRRYEHTHGLSRTPIISLSAAMEQNTVEGMDACLWKVRA